MIAAAEDIGGTAWSPGRCNVRSPSWATNHRKVPVVG
jgi:hypothetical protein